MNSRISWNQRISLFFRGRMDGLLDTLEDPERSLHQVVLDMEEQLEAAKRAAARAMANERRLRDRIDQLQRESAELDQGAARAVQKGHETEAREYLLRAEVARRRAEELDRQLDTQARDTEKVRLAVQRLGDRVDEARGRQQLLQAKIRQGQAREAMGKALGGARQISLSGELDRLSDRLSSRAEEAEAYLELDDHLSGEDLRRRCSEESMAEAVEERLANLRAAEVVENPTPKPPGKAAEETS